MGEANKLKVVGVVPADPAEEIPVSIAALPASEVNVTKIGGTAQTGRNITQDLKALIDDSIKGLMRSIGDAGATPTNQTGMTLLKIIDLIWDKLDGWGPNVLAEWGGTELTGRDVTLDLKTLTDNSVTGILKSLETYLRSINGDTGTQINGYQLHQNGTAILHTVNANKNFYLSSSNLNLWNNAAAIKNAYIAVRNGADTFQYYLSHTYTFGNTVQNQTRLFTPPKKIPAGWDIYSVSADTDTKVIAIIDGWEEAG